MFSWRTGEHSAYTAAGIGEWSGSGDRQQSTFGNRLPVYPAYYPAQATALCAGAMDDDVNPLSGQWAAGFIAGGAWARCGRLPERGANSTRAARCLCHAEPGHRNMSDDTN